MIELPEDWMTIGVLDIERKQYELLAYLQKVERKFNNLELYPYFSDLMRHYKNTIIIKDNKNAYREGFPKQLIDINLEDTTLKYESLVIDEGWMFEIDFLIDFALEELKEKIIVGKFIYDEVEKCTDLLPMGIIHSENDKGYFIIHDDTIDVYEYELVKVLLGVKTGGLKTKLVRSYPKGYLLSYESIRLDLIEGSNIINPSIFIIDCPIKYPVEKTLLPIAKRMLVKKLTQQ